MAGKFYGDVLYDVWHGGGSVDLVDPDRVAESEACGLTVDEAADRELTQQRSRETYDDGEDW